MHSSWFSVLPLRAAFLFLYLHHLYAEVSGKYCGNACQRGEWHYDCRIVCIHAYSTTDWRAVGIRLVAVPQCYVSVHWQPFLPFLFSQHCKTFIGLCRFWSGDVCPADSEFLYINQWNTGKVGSITGTGSRIRVGLSYAVANAIFGGSAEYVALSLKSIGMETAFFWYVTLMAVVAFLVSLMLVRKGKGDASLVTGQLPDGIAGACTDNLQANCSPAPATPSGRLSQSSFDAPKLTENVIQSSHCDPGSSPDAVNIHCGGKRRQRR